MDQSSDDVNQDKRQTSRGNDQDRSADAEFELIQHERREPTIAEESLVGKVFIDDGDRFIVRLVRYHPKQKVMMCWYERLEKRGSEWIGTGQSELSSVPEVQYWIERSAKELYPSNQVRRSARNKG